MAHAKKGDPLKKQKDSLSFKNKTVQFWKSAATEAVAGIPAMLENTGRQAAGKIAKEVRKHNPLTRNIYFDTTKPKPKKKPKFKMGK